MGEFKIEAPSVLLPKLSGVYKLIFPKGEFYYGSTMDLRNKFSDYESAIRNGAKLTAGMWKAIRANDSMKIEIVAICYNKQEALAIEDKYIKLFFGNPLLINRSPSAYSSKGLKRTQEENQRQKEMITDETRAKLRERMIGNNLSAYLRKKVAQFDKSGNMIEVHPSITAAAKNTGVNENNMRRYLNGEGITYKGFIFNLIDNQGNIIERQVKPWKKRKGQIKSGLINGQTKALVEKRFNIIQELAPK